MESDIMNFILIAIVICGTIYVGFKFINGQKNESFVGTIFTAGGSFISLASGNWQDTLVKIVAIINNRKEYKEITNFDKPKEKLQNMKLELPDVPEIDDIKMVRWSKKRDEKILEDIIKPKDDLINELYQNNLQMHQQLLRQAKMVEEAEKYQKERNKIMADNRDLHKQVDDIKAEYKQKEDNLEWKYDYKIRTLEKENGYLHNVIDKFRETIHKFIEWICVNFDMGTGDTLIRDFERETRTCLDGEEQIKRESAKKSDNVISKPSQMYNKFSIRIVFVFLVKN